MRKIIISLLMAISLTGCNLSEEVQAFTENINTSRVWVFLQLNVPEEDEKIESYYYYAEISESLYKKINANELSSGFLYMMNVKYWDNDDILREYKDHESSGELVFRIEDIRRIERLNQEPVDEESSTTSEEPVKTETSNSEESDAT